MQHNACRERLLVAVVDDDKPIVDLLCELLQEEGYQTVACLTAIEAHRVIRKTRPNLVILDLHLDGSGNGLTVLDTLRLVPATADIPVIVCSADAYLLKQKEYELRLSKCEIVEKPFDLTVFLNTLEQMVGRPRDGRRNLPATASSTTLRATKRLIQKERTDDRAFTVLPGGIDSLPIEEFATQHDALENDVFTLIHRSQQLDKRTQLLIKEAQRLRLQSLNLARENMSIQNRLNYVSWLTAMAGPQPRWLWRKRTSYDE
jgi:CheY-like chemotaxis protein